MNEIINSILEAENFADNLLRESQEKARKIFKECSEKADLIKEEAISSFRNIKADGIKEANEKAEKEYQKKIEQGRIDSDAFIGSVRPKVNSVIEETLRDLIK